MRRISGRCQRGIRYALWALGEATTIEILEYCYPWPGEDRRQRKNRARAVCLAARKTIASPARLWHTATELTETAEPAEPDAKRYGESIVRIRNVLDEPHLSEALSFRQNRRTILGQRPRIRRWE
jgi:hypothetical protein